VVWSFLSKTKQYNIYNTHLQSKLTTLTTLVFTKPSLTQTHNTHQLTYKYKYTFYTSYHIYNLAAIYHAAQFIMAKSFTQSGSLDLGLLSLS